MKISQINKNSFITIKINVNKFCMEFIIGISTIKIIVHIKYRTFQSPETL